MAQGREAYYEYLERTLGLTLAVRILGPNAANPVGVAQVNPTTQAVMDSIRAVDETFRVFRRLTVFELMAGISLSEHSLENVRKLMAFMTGEESANYTGLMVNSPMAEACKAALKLQFPGMIGFDVHRSEPKILTDWVNEQSEAFDEGVLVMALENKTGVLFAAA